MSAPRAKANLETLLASEGEALLRTAIERGRAGDAAALKLAIDRLMPPLKERSIKVELPRVESASDLLKAIGAIVDRVAAGALTPGEGSVLVGMLSSMRAAFETCELAARLEAFERALPMPSAAGPGSGGMGLKDRIAGAEARLRLLSPSLRVIAIEGGLQSGVGGIATIGNLLLVMTRADGESESDFRARAKAAARELGVQTIIFGGLPVMMTFEEDAPISVKKTFQSRSKQPEGV
jgi:hypothetical protein